MQALLVTPVVRHTSTAELVAMVARGDSCLLFRMRNTAMELEMRHGTQAHFRRM